ncbi:MAG: extracellular solute-binding protein [Jiangellaceae bacterium]|nr:extracellular solute-binding protein [Jiangellaceae bacterium]
MIHTRHLLAVGASMTAIGLTTACNGGSGFEEDEAGEPAQETGPAAITVLIGSSGPAETDAVEAAAAAWADESGNTAEVIAATDLNQQLSQGFAAGDPPDVFYMGADTFADNAATGSLLAYASELENADDFYPTLVEAFTFEDEFYCAPKDFSTLALEINTASWEAAGLTDDDIPTSWDELHQVAQQLTTDSQAGLVSSMEYQRLGAFMVQAGSNLVTDGEATANSSENVEALEFVQSMLADDSLKTTGEVGAGWGGEAFGTAKSAMTIEGNWIAGAMAADFPDVQYRVVPLPEGPAGPGTLSFTNCWGIAADSDQQEAAMDFVAFMTAPEQQLEFARGFGVMPSVQSAAEDYKAEFPDMAAFIDQAEAADTVPNQPGVTAVIADLNGQLESLETADPKAILDNAQANLEAALGG